VLKSIFSLSNYEPIEGLDFYLRFIFVFPYREIVFFKKKIQAQMNSDFVPTTAHKLILPFLTQSHAKTTYKPFFYYISEMQKQA